MCVHVGQRAVGTTAKETNCYSLLVEVFTESRRGETRLPALFTVILAAQMKLYFLFCQEFQQPAALFGGCGFGLFERVYLKPFHNSDRHVDIYKISRFFLSVNDKQSSELTFVAFL